MDIKPYIQYSDAIVEAQSGYAQDEPSRKTVIWSDEGEQQKQQLLGNRKISVQTIQELEAVLSLDPRPAYQEDEERVYGMKFADLDVKFKIGDNKVKIQELKVPVFLK